MDKIDYLNNILQGLPEGPGVYQFFNGQEQIIYVGKAKNLKRRVSSYFQKSHHDSAKVRVMVNKICNIRYILVDTESDALLLENNLIKKYKPRYNVLLKDDKTYPWICVKSEQFPRVFSTRNLVKDGSVYFGPYTSVVMVRTLLELIRKLFQLRTCSLPLSYQNICLGKFKVCLEYHIGNCKGPCVGEQSEAEYNQSITQIKDILRGNIHQVVLYLKDLMLKYANEYRFEDAETVRQKIEIIEKFQSKSTVVSASINNVDVFSLIEEKNVAIVNFIKVMNGAIIQAHTIELVKRLDEDKEELLSLAIADIRERFQSLSREILIPFPIDFEIFGVTITIPKIGDKKKLLELSERNAKYYLLERNRHIEKTNPEKRVERIMETMKRDLHLNEFPLHIECFDNSNIQGTHPVASCVVFKNGRPSKSDYRHFNIKTVEGPNDFASMEEIIFRRYKRLLDEGISLPQLIVIDGGKGQLHAAINSIEKLEIYGKVAIIGIAKRLEEIYFPGDSVPIYLDKQSETLKVIQHIRNEAHRFGITFHRNKRSKSMANSALDGILGIGNKTVELLYNKYASISNMKKVPVSELEELIGKKRTEILLKYFES
ncbi:MAG: excinuclease ABC subunit UvrC [Bacteroidota bacterium]|nr:excinuclease ABC subunit UvrC [Bacteroidota bacterium]